MRTYARRDILRSTAAAAAWLAASGAGRANAGDPGGPGGPAFEAPRPFSFDRLIERAAGLAEQPYSPPPAPAPEIVAQIDYDAHGAIQYRRDLALAADGPGVFPVTFFHLGRLFPNPVGMHLVTGARARKLRYARRYFDMPADSIAREMPPDAGFAGFRLHESRRRGDWRTQDWVAFLGASYFRAIGALGQYGLSARGVAIDTATGGPEEFPRFTDFYIAPAESEEAPTFVYALLDGPSVTGAYRFEIARTAGVVMDVEAHLFIRADVDRLGIAPLTSMFWYAQHDQPAHPGWRPEVHDSDGLAVWTGRGERLWRPLNNPKRTQVSAFADRRPRGFGLFQRDRDFEHYLDCVHYERRPSAWVEPLDDWGEGAVELIEIPTNDEFHDNIVALWRPARPAAAGTSLTFRYRLHWLAEHPHPAPALARCVATRIGHGEAAGSGRPAGVRTFVVEFAGPPLERLGPYDEPVAVVSASRGVISSVETERLPGRGRWRALFDMAANGEEPADLRLYLRLGERALTETWVYQHLPAPAS